MFSGRMMIVRNPHTNRRAVLSALTLLVALGSAARADDEVKRVVDPGEQVYQRQCASCHGDKGQGVRGEYRKPLIGDWSIPKLAKYIDEDMPEETPEECAGEDAENVARYIWHAFYSPIAQARNRPPRVELSRLTVRQHRNALADLVATFRRAARVGDRRGLSATYYDNRQPSGRAKVERLDSRVQFDFASPDADVAKLGNRGFAARWSGSLLPPEPGRYEIVVRTDHAVRQWVNDLQTPLIDAWVKSGDETEYHASISLIDGRAYPLRLEFTSRDQGVKKDKKAGAKPKPAFAELCWKLPGRVVETIPSRCLVPDSVPEVFVVTAPFPPDDRSVGYERGASASAAWNSAKTAAAVETADYVIEHLVELSGARDNAGDRDAKLRAFCRRWVERAFRRPLTDAQRKLYVDGVFASAPDLSAAVKRVVLLTLESPRFLYLGLGSKQPDSWAVASRLSFALWDSPPDRELLDAAKAGRLMSRDQIALHAARLVTHPRAHSKMRQFLRSWLAVEHTEDLAKTKARELEFDEALASDLRTSLDLFLDEVVWGESGDFRRLILSRDLWINGRLAEYYGFDLSPDAPFQKVSAKWPQRVGVVSHPFLMANFAYGEATSPIHRGVFLVRSVLGRALRPPPAALAPLAPDLHPNLTTRERVALQTSAKPCQMCHAMINPLGFTLEHFDAVGRFRGEERGRPIDASGSYELEGGERKTFDDAHALAAFLADSEQVHGAFVLQLFHHLVKQPIVAYGTDTKSDLRRTFATNDFDIRKLMAEIAITAAVHGVERVAIAPHAPEDALPSGTDT